MGNMKTYLIEKLSDMNNRIAVHEGNANRRLASEAKHILLLPQNEIPACHRKEFDSLRQLIEETIKPLGGLTPSRLNRIQDRTAAKYIKLLINIQDTLEKDNLLPEL